MIIGERISYLREREGMSQAGLARAIGSTRASVNAWEMGISAPSTALIVDLATHFDVSTDYLLGVNTTATLDVSSLNDKEIMLIYEIIQHFKESKLPENDK